MGLLLFFLFLFGLAIGSFLNVLILRLNTGVSVRGRSRCFSCLKKLAWHDLVPLASFVAIRGRCRYCGSSLSIQYPLVELATGILFVSAAYVVFGSTVPQPIDILHYALVVTFFSILLAAAVYDIRHKIIPDQLSVALFVLALAVELLTIYADSSSTASSWVGDALGAIGAFGFFAALWFLSKGRWMGLGDGKLALSLGLFLGFPAIILALLFAVWIAALFGLSMMALGSYGMKTEVPFAPFLAVGTFLVFLLLWSPMNAILYQYFVFL